jgi:uncharacterized protein YkwD
MGKATILSAIGEGQYSVLVNMGRERIEAELAQIQADLNALNPELDEAEEALEWAELDLESALFNLDFLIAEYAAAGASMDDDPEDQPDLPGFTVSEVISAHNTIRAQHGLGSLSGNSALHSAAAGHARYMAANDFVGHRGALGTYAAERADAAGYAWVAIGENCAGGGESLQQVMNGWMNSPGHRANILRGDFTEIGVGLVYRDNSTWRHFWVIKFGDR